MLIKILGYHPTNLQAVHGFQDSKLQGLKKKKKSQPFLQRLSGRLLHWRYLQDITDPP
jgi:hypothetical protein